MSTVRQRRKNGSVYVYDSRNVWDKDLKKYRAVRTYLGREDPVTGELIPSSGRPGRRAQAPACDTPAAAPAPAPASAAPDDALRLRVSELESELARLRAELDLRSAELASARRAISSAVSALASA